ncbi:GL14797 [Drosophila persimilis]|uniref:GL14797 n=1 Tax=Drosophila persimilis TaxID=7234 RepID=B4HA01_DROPE|nr:GL14797 [Drosophila persimilis]
MDDRDKAQHNMISNLPLLFANGYPTSLEKISESQLESFIPFMVQCSLGHINLPKKIDCSEPEWWPENAPFGIPLKKPNDFVGVNIYRIIFFLN